MAIASLVCGALFFIPVVPPVLAIIFGIRGLQRTKDSRVGGRGLAIAGLVLGSVEFLLTIMMMVLYMLVAPRAVSFTACPTARMATAFPALSQPAEACGPEETGTAAQPAATVGLEKLVGQRVALTGFYGGPGKFAVGYIKLNDKEWVYFKGKMSGLTPTFGQHIAASGILRCDPGFKPPAQETLVDGLPAHYFFEFAEIFAVQETPVASQPNE